MLSYNERGIRKLQENFTCFHDKVAEEDVYQSFMTIVGKSKKFAKPEVKVNFYLSMSQLEARTCVVTTAFACDGFFTVVASCYGGGVGGCVYLGRGYITRLVVSYTVYSKEINFKTYRTESLHF